MTPNRQLSPGHGADRDEIPQADALRLWLSMLAGCEPPGGYLEVRKRLVGRDVRRYGFIPIDDLPAVVEVIHRLSGIGDVWVGVAPRRAQRGGLDAIAHVWCLWADADTHDACEGIRAFTPEPTFVIRSGTDEHLHAYWAVDSPLTTDQAKRGNRRLAHHLGADLNACDGARIMRPPGTSRKMIGAWQTSPSLQPVLPRRDAGRAHAQTLS